MIWNTTSSYGSVLKFLHWLIFLLVIIMLTVGFIMGSLPDTYKPAVYNIHKLTGLSILTLMIIRLLWKWSNPIPLLPPQTVPWERSLTRLVHGLFYVVLIAMPISGWVMATAADHPPVLFGFQLAMPGIQFNKALSNQAANFHEFFAWTLIILILFHTLAALKHYYINKDQILQRMLP